MDLGDTIGEKNETRIHQETTSVTTSDCSSERQVRRSGDPLTSSWFSQVCSWLISLPDETPTHLTFEDAAFLSPAPFLCFPSPYQELAELGRTLILCSCVNTLGHKEPTPIHAPVLCQVLAIHLQDNCGNQETYEMVMALR